MNIHDKLIQVSTVVNDMDTLSLHFPSKNLMKIGAHFS